MTGEKFDRNISIKFGVLGLYALAELFNHLAMQNIFTKYKFIHALSNYL